MTELRRPPTLRWDGALELVVESTCDDLVVFDEPTHAVCVEPQTGPPDALRLTPVLVEPGWPLVAEATFAWHPL
jgi:aldose 1-epimerase